MNLTDVERLVSRAQILSIVDAMGRKLALWYGSVSAGKTVAFRGQAVTVRERDSMTQDRIAIDAVSDYLAARLKGC